MPATPGGNNPGYQIVVVLRGFDRQVRGRGLAKTQMSGGIAVCLKP
jgi:hypothetical protein